MKKILVPISFSANSKSALRQAHQISKHTGATITLIHCYPVHEYNREHDFGDEDYDVGIKKKLKKFYNQCLGDTEKIKKSQLIAYAGNVSQFLPKMTPKYDLLVLCRKTDEKTKTHSRFSDKIFYFFTKALCSVLITPGDVQFEYDKIQTIWHIKRNESEVELLNQQLPFYKLNPKAVIQKSLEQTSFVSKFWKNVVTYLNTDNKDLLKDIEEGIDAEHIDLMVVVNHRKGFFESFVKGKSFQTIYQFDIPILILQKKPDENI